jgi:pyruvate dehydrogenase E1 component
MNENYVQPKLKPNALNGIIRGMYLFDTRKQDSEPAVVRLLGSGAIFREVIAAGHLLFEDWGIASPPGWCQLSPPEWCCMSTAWAFAMAA